MQDLNQPIGALGALALARRLSLLSYWRSFLEDETVASIIAGESAVARQPRSTQMDEQLTLWSRTEIMALQS